MLVIDKGARLFWSRANFENYFSSQSSLFKSNDDKFTIHAKQEYFLVFLMLFLTVFGQISGSRRSRLLFLIPEKGPRAAKINRRATLWPCLYRPAVSNTIATSHMWLVVIYIVAIWNFRSQKVLFFKRIFRSLCTKFEERYHLPKAFAKYLNSHLVLSILTLFKQKIII